MTAADAGTAPSFSPRVAIQKVGTSLSNMVMPNIPALIAWGILTALFIPDGYLPSESLATLVGPTIHYLLPLMIANTGGRMVYGDRGGIVAVVSTMGVIGGSDWLIDQVNATLPEGADQLGQIHMFIGAMIMAPLSAWLMKKLDALWADHIPNGFEMLVNLFSAGIFSFLMAIVGFFGLAPIVNTIMDLMGKAVAWLIDHSLLPLVSIIIEPAKVFFLNNAINHGVLTPLGTVESSTDGKSILYLLEANPGPGLGILLAFTVFGVGMAKASAPGAAIIHFFGGIHEIYFPYVLMRPQLILAVILGGMTGVAVNMVLDTGLRAPSSPGSILAIMAQAAPGDHIKILLAVLLSTAVTFVVAMVMLKLSKKTEDDLEAATAKMESLKGKKSSVSGALTGDKKIAESEAELRDYASGHNRFQRIVFACDAGMGSSAMGASALRKKVRKAGFADVEVVNRAISNLTDEWDLIVTHRDLAARAYPATPSAVHVAVDNFMNSPRYDEIVALLEDRAKGADASAAEADAQTGGAAATAAQAGDAAATAAQAGDAAASDAPTSGAPADDHHVDAAEAEPAAILSTDAIVLKGTAQDLNGAITEAGQLLVASGAVDEAYVAAMHEREESVSTFMGNGLAIPHGTNEAKSSIRRSAMSVVRYDQPIDWNGQSVHFVVGIAGKGDEHLAILQNVAMVFSDADQVKRLENAQTEAELLDIFTTED